MNVAPASPYPVQYHVQPQLTGRNRMTVFFRFFLALPHLMILGGAGLGAGYAASDGWSRWGGGATGLEGVAGTMAVVAWFAIIFWKQHPRGLWDFAAYYLRWLSKAAAYFALLRDEYPPFGEGDYPVTFDVGEFPANESRNRWSVGLRVLYAIPHFIALIFIGIAAFFVLVLSWFAILFTGNFPEGLYGFVTGVLRWSIRVQAYVFLMRDEYPPFALS